MNIDTAYFPNTGCMINPHLCEFEMSLNLAGGITTLVVILGILYTYNLLRQKTKQPFWHMLLMGTGILLFELFTAPMWNSEHLGRFNYVYNDLSLTFTLGWISLFLLTVYWVDKVFTRVSVIGRFFIYLIPISILSILSENLMVWGGVRAYAPEIWQTSVGRLGLIPIESLYYAPVFSALVLSFYLAWTRTGKADLRKAFALNGLGLTVIILAVGITMYELLIEPVVTAPGFPAWSYFYQDISWLRIGLWIGMLFAGMMIGNAFLKADKKLDQKHIFWAYVLGGSVVFYLIEMVLLASRSRIYTESVTSNFTGLKVPLLGSPIEIMIAVVIYNVLIVSFLKYWHSVLRLK